MNIYIYMYYMHWQPLRSALLGGPSPPKQTNVSSSVGHLIHSKYFIGNVFNSILNESRRHTSRCLHASWQRERERDIESESVLPDSILRRWGCVFIASSNWDYRTEVRFGYISATIPAHSVCTWLQSECVYAMHTLHTQESALTWESVRILDKNMLYDADMV